MVVVSDTTAICNLFKIQKLELLHQLYNEILIPDEVFEELNNWVSFENDAIEILEKYWIRRKSIVAIPKELRMFDLDEGELQAIELAIEIKADLIVMDEKLGRHVAEKFGLNVIGLLGVLKTAKERGMITDVKSLLLRLKNEAGFRISDNLFNRILSESNEL